ALPILPRCADGYTNARVGRRPLAGVRTKTLRRACRPGRRVRPAVRVLRRPRRRARHRAARGAGDARPTLLEPTGLFLGGRRSPGPPGSVAGRFTWRDV